MILVTDRLKIDPAELQFSFAKASGSGGQKVNKTNSQVELRWNIYSSKSLTEKQRELIEQNLRSKLSKEGDLIITSEIARSQHMNKQNCIDKFIQTLDRATHIPKPRKKTRPTRASKERRIKDKKVKSDIKKNRKKVDY